MNYSIFVQDNPNLFNELTNRLIMYPEEKTLKECCGAIALRISLQYPYMNPELVIEHSWKIIEEYLLPRVQNKQKQIMSMINPNMMKTNYGNNFYKKSETFAITEGEAWLYGIIIFVGCCICLAIEIFSEGTTIMVMLISEIILYILPKKQ